MSDKQEHNFDYHLNNHNRIHFPHFASNSTDVNVCGFKCLSVKHTHKFPLNSQQNWTFLSLCAHNSDLLRFRSHKTRFDAQLHMQCVILCVMCILTHFIINFFSSSFSFFLFELIYADDVTWSRYTFRCTHIFEFKPHCIVERFA